MIDSHAHIVNEFYDDIGDAVNKIKSEKIIAVINCSDSLETAKEVLSYSKKYENFLLPTAGIHPENIDELDISILSELEDLVKNNKFVAIGETGLDYNYNDENKDKQKEFFIRQIEIANKYNLPVIVHSRDAAQDTFDILKEHRCKGVVHCYSGSAEMAREYVKLGYYLGIGGVVTFKNSKLYEVIESIDLKNILIETDSPFLSPEPFRGKKNIPSNVIYVAKKIAEIKKMNVEDVIKITNENCINIFDLNL